MNGVGPTRHSWNRPIGGPSNAHVLALSQLAGFMALLDVSIVVPESAVVWWIAWRATTS
jgi:hypothetical protein